MKYIGKHMSRETYYINIKEDYRNKLPISNWVCFALANEMPDEIVLTDFIRNSIKNDIFEFKGFGLFGGYLHTAFDLEIVKMEVDEGCTEIEIKTTGSNDTDLAIAFWENYGATCLPDRADYENIKVICINFDENDFSKRLTQLLNRFNKKWLPIYEDRIMVKDNNILNLELTKNEALVFYEFLSRINESDRKELFEHQAEEKILWDLESILEKQLNETFRTDYNEIIEKARIQIIMENE
jgi:hypothetical protein